MMSRFNPKGLRARLLLLAFLTAVPLAALIIGTAFEQRAQAMRRLQDEAARLAARASHEEGLLVREAQDLLAVLAQLPSVRGREIDTCNRIFAELLARHKRYANIGLADRAGNVIASGIPTKEAVGIADRPYFRRALEKREFSIGEYQVGRITGKPGLNFGYPILGSSGEVKAVLFAAVDLAWLGKLSSEAGAAPPPGSTVTRFDRNGVVISHIPDGEELIGKPFPVPGLTAQVLSRGQGIVEAAGRDGKTRLYAFTRAHRSGGTEDLFVILGIPRETLFAGADRRLTTNLVGLAVVVALAFGTASLGARGLVLRPVSAVLAAVNRISGGDYSARTGVPPSSGEIGELAGGVDRMAESLAQRDAARREAEEALGRSEEQFLQAQKMEAVGRLAGGVAHDFNNLLTAILGYAELLLARMGPAEAGRPEIEEIRKAGARAAALTRQLLTFSRRQVLQPAVLDLNAVVTGMEGMMKRLIGEDIAVRTELAPGLWPVKADPGQLEQLIVNLAVNARDAMPQGGTLALRTRNVLFREAKSGRDVELPAGPYVMLAIADTGCGMDAETMSHLFEPFFTTKEKGKGTGLGLSTVYGIVRQSRGAIEAESALGAGTTMTVYLPKAADAVPDPPAPREGAAVEGGRETILVVEDEEAVRELVCEVLRNNGYTALSVADGPGALALCEGREGPIDLLISDVVMPGMNGRELANRVAGLRPGIRVLYMSGYPQDVIGQHGVIERGIEFIQKPFSATAMARRVREILDRGPAA